MDSEVNNCHKLLSLSDISMSCSEACDDHDCIILSLLKNLIRSGAAVVTEEISVCMSVDKCLKKSFLSMSLTCSKKVKKRHNKKPPILVHKD